MYDGIIKITLVVCDRIVYDKLTSCVVNRVLIGGNPEVIHSVWWSVVVCGGLWWSVCGGVVLFDEWESEWENVDNTVLTSNAR